MPVKEQNDKKTNRIIISDLFDGEITVSQLYNICIAGIDFKNTINSDTEISTQNDKEYAVMVGNDIISLFVAFKDNITSNKLSNKRVDNVKKALIELSKSSQTWTNTWKQYKSMTTLKIIHEHIKQYHNNILVD